MKLVYQTLEPIKILIQHQSNSWNATKIAPWGSLATKTTEIFSYPKKLDEGKKHLLLIQ